MNHRATAQVVLTIANDTDHLFAQYFTLPPAGWRRRIFKWRRAALNKLPQRWMYGCRNEDFKFLFAGVLYRLWKQISPWDDKSTPPQYLHQLACKQCVHNFSEKHWQATDASSGDLIVFNSVGTGAVRHSDGNLNGNPLSFSGKCGRNNVEQLVDSNQEVSGIKAERKKAWHATVGRWQ